MTKFKLLATLLVVALCTTAVLTSCGGEREPITSSHFKQVMTENGYRIVDITYQHSYDHVILVLAAINSAETHRFLFFELNSSGSARASFDATRSSFEAARSSPSRQSHSSNSLRNVCRFRLTSGGWHRELLRTGNTMIAVQVDSSYRDLVRSIIDDLKNREHHASCTYGYENQIHSENSCNLHYLLI